MENDKLKFEKEYLLITDYSKPAPIIESLPHGGMWNPKGSTLIDWFMKQLKKQSKIPKSKNSVECPNCGQMMVTGLICEKCGCVKTN